jgi:hypothetical protein
VKVEDTILYDLPSGYSFLSWTCTGGLTCSTTANPTTLTITGPGSIVLNLQTTTQRYVNLNVVNIISNVVNGSRHRHTPIYDEHFPSKANVDILFTVDNGSNPRVPMGIYYGNLLLRGLFWAWPSWHWQGAAGDSR